MVFAFLRYAHAGLACRRRYGTLAEKNSSVFRSLHVYIGCRFRFWTGLVSRAHIFLAHTRLMGPKGCVACSTWVPMNKDYPAAFGSGAKDIPVAQFHGTRDEVVRFTWGQSRSVSPCLTPFKLLCGMEIAGLGTPNLHNPVGLSVATLVWVTRRAIDPFLYTR